jgi:hypothetical protein
MTRVLPWKLTWRMYHSTYNWNGLPLTMCMLLLTVATYGAPRVRALYVRHNHSVSYHTPMADGCNPSGNSRVSVLAKSSLAH